MLRKNGKSAEVWSLPGIPAADGTTDVTVREEFSGPLLALFARTLPDMTQPFADFVAGLKARAESM